MGSWYILYIWTDRKVRVGFAATYAPAWMTSILGKDLGKTMANCIVKLLQQYGVLMEKFGCWTGTESARSEMKNNAKKIQDSWTAVILHKTAMEQH